MEEITIHYHHHFHFPSEPGQGKILEAIREVKELTMNLNDTLAELTADDTELAADVNALVSIINDIPARIQGAVAGALTDAGVADENIRTALNNVDSTVKDAIAAAKAVLPATSPPAATDTGATDSLSGGEGNDTVIGGSTGSPDTGLSEGGSSAADAGGGSTPAATDATSTTTPTSSDPGTGNPAVPPPSASSPT